MGLKSNQHTCSMPTCPNLHCSFYFSPHLRKQDARFFFSLSPLCTFQRWALRTATTERSKPPPLPRRRSSVEWMAVFEAPSWALAKRRKKGRKNLSFWACPPRHFILCQGSTRFTGQTLDRGHLLAFLDLRTRPDVNVQPPPPKKNTTDHDSLMRQRSATPTRPSYPPCLPPAPPRHVSLRTLKTTGSSTSTQWPPLSLSFCTVYMSAVHLAVQLWSQWFTFRILATATPQSRVISPRINEIEHRRPQFKWSVKKQ